jgi:hypothetical protein
MSTPAIIFYLAMMNALVWGAYVMFRRQRREELAPDIDSGSVCWRCLKPFPSQVHRYRNATPCTCKK